MSVGFNKKVWKRNVILSVVASFIVAMGLLMVVLCKVRMGTLEGDIRYQLGMPDLVQQYAQFQHNFVAGIIITAIWLIIDILFIVSAISVKAERIEVGETGITCVAKNAVLFLALGSKKAEIAYADLCGVERGDTRLTLKTKAGKRYIIDLASPADAENAIMAHRTA